MNVNFVSEFNAIMDRSRKECLGAGVRLLWIALFYLANDRARLSAANTWDWPDDFFAVDNNELSLHCPLEKRKILDARNRLKQLGVIDFKPGRNNSENPKYKIIYQSVQRCKIAPVNCTADAPVTVPVDVPVTVPPFVPFSINKDNNININNKPNIIDNIRPMVRDDELRIHQDDHDQIFELWTKCGFTLTERVMDQLVDMYSVHGVEKVVESIKATGDASPRAPMQYLQTVIAGNRKKEPVQSYAGGKTVYAQQFTQREYTHEADYLDQLLSRETEC